MEAPAKACVGTNHHGHVAQYQLTAIRVHLIDRATELNG
jgi:hypothetical protein